MPLSSVQCVSVSTEPGSKAEPVLPTQKLRWVFYGTCRKRAVLRKHEVVTTSSDVAWRSARASLSDVRLIHAEPA